jgi:hypothetical protein
LEVARKGHIHKTAQESHRLVFVLFGYPNSGVVMKTHPWLKNRPFWIISGYTSSSIGKEKSDPLSLLA